MERYNRAFTPANVESAAGACGPELDSLPFGVIVVDRNGTIVEYNEYEQQLAGRIADVKGKNFFKDVAPWAADNDFASRWDEFIASRGTTMIPFDFTVPGAAGPEQVTVMFVRVNFDDDHATICIAGRGNRPHS